MYSKKANVVTDVAFFIFLSFLYFMIGLPVMASILDGLIESIGLTGFLLFCAQIAPFIPLAAIVWLGYKKTQPEQQSSLFGGGQE